MSDSNIPTIDILTDTWQTVINRTNSLITALSTEVLTANSIGSTTGSPISPRNASLYGSFSANNLATIAGKFSANDTFIVIGNQVKVLANSSIGNTGYVLTSGGIGGDVYWSNPGSVTSVANGAGLVGGPITTSGTLSVKAGTGIIVNANGVNIDTTVVGSVQNVANGAGLVGGPITTSGTLSVKAGTNIVVDSNGVSVSANVVTINQFTQSLSSSGYTILPNGLIIQWGTTGYLGGEGDVTVSFPITFPHACLNAVATMRSPTANNTNNDIWGKIYNFTTSTISINYGASSGGNQGWGSYWMAIGY